jgi:ABC-2 type transport system permease protein
MALATLFTDRAMLITDFIVATSIPFVIQWMLWSWIYAERDGLPVGGFTQRDLMFYYAFALVFGRFNNGYDIIRSLAHAIDTGTLDVLVTKPLAVPLRQLCMFVGESALYLLPIVAVWGALAVSGNGQSWAAWSVAGMVVVIVLAQVLTFLFALALGLCAFWIRKSNFLCMLQITLAAVLGGGFLPGGLWPDSVSGLMMLNPFYLQVGALAELALRPTPERLLDVIGLQSLWAVALGGVALCLWRSGMARYRGAGG